MPEGRGYIFAADFSAGAGGGGIPPMKGDRVLANERRTHNILPPPIYFTKTPSPSHGIAAETNRVPIPKKIYFATKIQAK